MQKDVRKRVADIRDVRLALEGAFETVSPQVAEAAAVARPIWRQPFPVAAATILVTGFVIGLTAWNLWPTPDPQPANRFSYDLLEGQPFTLSNVNLLAVSPDGRHFVYDSQDGLVLRPMGELEGRLIPGTASDTFAPFFSPDGQSVAYFDFAQGQLERIAISGGAPVVITEMGSVYGMSWEADGTILIGQNDGIYRVSANGGTPRLVIEADDAGESTVHACCPMGTLCCSA